MYFYENPLASDGNYRREPWFACACCPPNIARTLASLPGYVYSTSENSIWVHLYGANAAEVDLDGRTIRLEQRGDYPWDENVDIVVGSEGDFALMLRVPAWCEIGATIAVNGESLSETPEPGSYARIDRSWQPGDVVRLTFPMPVRLIEAHPYVDAASERIAVTRGPILYCAEQADNPGFDLRDARLITDAHIVVKPGTGALAGLPILRAEVLVESLDSDWNEHLYRTRRGSTVASTRRSSLTLVPYFAWANREPGRMTVWVRVAGVRAV